MDINISLLFSVLHHLLARPLSPVCVSVILLDSTNGSGLQFVTAFFCVPAFVLWPHRTDNRQLLCQVLRIAYLYATGGRRPSEIIDTSLTPHHGPVFSLHQRLPTSSLHLSLSPELSSDGWHRLPCKTTFPAAPAPHYTSTSLLDEWWHSNCRSFRFH